ncbi:hypothetical protein E4U38_006222 [Claviceps purpurea]|nr:hypothetical protein E4U38_006222 [Claviceps purpurea]
MSINTASVKSDTSMLDAPPFLHQATHRSIAEKHPDITIPDAPPLPNQPEQQYTGMASITMRKFLASPVHYTYQPTVQEFAPASKEYLSQDGFPHAPRVFPQQNNVNSVLLKEESPLKGGFTQIPHRMHQPNPLQVRHAQVPISHTQPSLVRPQREEDPRAVQDMEALQ